MKVEPVHSVAGLVDVVWRGDLGAVCLKWHSEYDSGTAVREAVLAALAYVSAHGVQNWLADLSTSRKGLSSADLDWVNGQEFRSAIAGSSLTRFALIPPLPETGQDTGWLETWEIDTLAALGAGKQAKIASDMNEIRQFFGESTDGGKA